MWPFCLFKQNGHRKDVGLYSALLFKLMPKRSAIR